MSEQTEISEVNVMDEAIPIGLTDYEANWYCCGWADGWRKLDQRLPDDDAPALRGYLWGYAAALAAHDAREERGC